MPIDSAPKFPTGSETVQIVPDGHLFKIIVNRGQLRDGLFYIVKREDTSLIITVLTDVMTSFIQYYENERKAQDRILELYKKAGDGNAPEWTNPDLGPCYSLEFAVSDGDESKDYAHSINQKIKTFLDLVSEEYKMITQSEANLRKVNETNVTNHTQSFREKLREWFPFL